MTFWEFSSETQEAPSRGYTCSQQSLAMKMLQLGCLHVGESSGQASFMSHHLCQGGSFGGAAAFESPTVLNVTSVNSGLTKLGSGVWFVIFPSFVIMSPFVGTVDWNPSAASR